jgi:hypothetical protein
MWIRHMQHTLRYYLVETNLVGVLAEALTAEIKAVLADEGGALGADTAIVQKHTIAW